MIEKEAVVADNNNGGNPPPPAAQQTVTAQQLLQQAFSMWTQKAIMELNVLATFTQMSASRVMLIVARG
jgi:hypothetical protein